MGQRAIRAKALKSLTRKRTRATAADAAAPSPRDTSAGRRLAVEIARSLSDDKCEDIVVLDVSEISQVCDYFVLATGTSDRQMRASADHIEAVAKSLGESPFGRDGYEEGSWVLVDFVDVVVHLFAGELRAYYDLDSLWGDGPKVEWER